jgi:mannose-6-phosphate isomerase-like protein (cupin superfamily)
MKMNNSEKKLRTITNPVIGDEVTFIVTKEESGGEYELIEIRVVPGGGNVLHFHTAFEEQFEAVEGTLHVECAGIQYMLRPGQKFIVKPGMVHRFWNPASAPISFLIEIRPARHFEQGLRIGYGLARDGRVNTKNSVPTNLLELGVCFHLSETYLAGIPLFVQKSLSGILYRVARWSGVENRLKQKYCS